MTAIVCDVCKKVVPGARKDVNYFVILEKDLCVPCEDQLQDAVRDQMAARRPYQFADYKDVLAKTLARHTGGK